ncbi:MAG: HtaA domain-containing protein [Microbacteriaceae bacterium]|nr:HtaA domain-containing protein [Microbacteriaceae bacterium]
MQKKPHNSSKTTAVSSAKKRTWKTARKAVTTIAIAATALTIAPLATVNLPGTISPAFAVPNEDGHLHWGIRSSFNNYTGGATKVDEGASRVGNGFQFKLTDVTYDAATKTTTAQFKGTVLYRKYCENKENPLVGNCWLDLNFKNPKVVLSPEKSAIYATVSSKQYPLGGVYAPTEPVPVAELHPDSAMFSKADGRISWKDIPTTLTEEGLKMFSNFYNKGEGLDPLSFEYRGDGGRPAAASQKTLVASWDSLANKTTDAPGVEYADGVHRIFDANPYVIVQIPKNGFALLDADLKELGRVKADTGTVGTAAYDPETRTIYFAAKNSKDVQAVKVNGDKLEAPKTVYTATGNIQAFGYSPVSKKLIAIASNDMRTASLLTRNGDTFEAAELPTPEALFGGRMNPKNSEGPYGKKFNKKDQLELLPMKDGTFVYNPSADVYFDSETSVRKGLLLSIDPAGKTPADRAVFMSGSDHEMNVYLEGIATDGETIYRFNKHNSPNHAYAQVLQYNKRQVTGNRPEKGALPGWAGLAFTDEGVPIQLNGVDGTLKWLAPGTFNVTDTFSLPNGRETNNILINTFLVRSNGAIYVPTLDESQGDFKEHYVLRRLNTRANVVDAPAPGNDEAKLKELQEKHRKEVLAPLEVAATSAAKDLEKVKAEKASAEKIAVFEAKKQLADAKLMLAKGRFDAENGVAGAPTSDQLTAQQREVAKLEADVMAKEAALAAADKAESDRLAAEKAAAEKAEA